MLRRLRRRPKGSVGDFNEFLHELRSRELERLPAGAKTVLHGGCAGSWYFDWFAERYPTRVDRHIGVEAFAPRPPELGDEVEWLERSLGDLSPVEDGEVDLVFAGQVLEHLWPEEITAFLLESRRVLRPGGTLAMDSPNRRVTAAIRWAHPEHTVEFRSDEIGELLELAGFDDLRVRGVWLCFDRGRRRFLSLEGGPRERAWPAERRAAEAEDRPEDAFVWWVEAVRRDRQPDEDRLARRVDEIYADDRGFRLGRFDHTVGWESGVGRDRVVEAGVGEAGHLVFGPYVPMKAGPGVARFRAAAREAGAPGDVLAVADVVTAPDAVVARRELTATDLPGDGAFHELPLPFELERMELGVQFRLETTGRAPLAAFCHVDVDGPEPSASLPSERRADGVPA
jgi:SAM-dependent methyltransferase